MHWPPNLEPLPTQLPAVALEAAMCWPVTTLRALTTPPTHLRWLQQGHCLVVGHVNAAVTGITAAATTQARGPQPHSVSI